MVCPSSVSCLNAACVWFVNSLSCLNMCLGCLICVLSQYCPFLWFVHYVSCLNNACVFGLSIKWFLSILHVSLFCPLWVLPQYCLCLVCPLCVLSQYCMCLWFVHFQYCLNTACVSGLSIMCLASMLHVSLVCPLCVLSQKRLCLWFVHSVSCLNNACISGLFILYALSQCLPVSLVCPLCVRSQ
jgi:hypothetical protein